MKEYQSRKDKALILPAPVYHQCIWMIRDMPRMQRELNESRVDTGLILTEDTLRYDEMSLHEELSIQEIEFRLECVSKALDVVPEELRDGMLNSIINRGSGYESLAHENTWKYWKQRFIFTLARMLRLY